MIPLSSKQQRSPAILHNTHHIMYQLITAYCTLHLISCIHSTTCIQHHAHYIRMTPLSSKQQRSPAILHNTHHIMYQLITTHCTLHLASGIHSTTCIQHHAHYIRTIQSSSKQQRCLAILHNTHHIMYQLITAYCTRTLLAAFTAPPASNTIRTTSA